MGMIGYGWNRLLKKIRGCAIRNSVIDKTAKIGSGSTVVNSSIGKYSFCGYDCKLLNAKIGAFCSIADNIVIGGAEHPIDWVSTSPVFYSERSSVKKKFSTFHRNEDPVTSIGNDVWIGERVLIKGGVTIGDGAAIGMGSVLTKDVGPYEIWAGNPARKIRMRFDSDIVQGLSESRWWDLDDSDLAIYAKDIRDPGAFLKDLQI